MSKPTDNIVGGIPLAEAHLYLTHSYAELNELLAARNIGWEAPSTPGLTISDTKGDEIYLYVLLDMETAKDWPVWEQLSLIAHEAYHALSRYVDAIDGAALNEELTCRGLQYFTGTLFDEHLRWLDAQNGKTGTIFNALLRRNNRNYSQTDTEEV